MIKILAKDQIAVEVFVPPGSNPHTYEPSPEQIKQFTEVCVWFRTGDPVENKMVQFLQEREVQIVNLSAQETLLTGSSHKHGDMVHEEKDLHLWLDPTIVIKQVAKITAVLSKQFPALAPTLAKNSQELQIKLYQLNTDIHSKLAPFHGSYLLVSHPAFGYYCKQYDLHQISIEVEGKDPLPQDISHLMTRLKNHPVPVVFIEPQYNTKGALLIAEKLHIPHVEVNPYAEDYFKMLNDLTDLIVKYYDHPST